LTPGRGGSCNAIRPAKIKLVDDRVEPVEELLTIEEGELDIVYAQAMTRSPRFDIASLRALISARAVSSSGDVEKEDEG